MNNHPTRWLPVRALALLLACFLLLGAAALGEESAAEAEAASGAALWIGLNAGHSASDPEIQGYHQRAVALMRLLLMLETRFHPDVRICMIVGGARQELGVLPHFAWTDLAALDALEGGAFASREVSTPGLDLLTFLEARAKEAVQAGETGIYWLDRLTAPDLGSASTGAPLYIRALTALLENPEAEIYLAFAKDDRGRLESFQAQVIDALENRGRVHVLLYGAEDLAACLRQMNRRTLGAVYMGDLDCTEKTERTASFALASSDAPGKDRLLWIQGTADIQEIRFQGAGSDGVAYSAVLLGKEAMVLLPAQEESAASLKVACAEPSDLIAESFLLPVGQATLTAEDVQEGLTLYRDAKRLQLSVDALGLPARCVDIWAEAAYDPEEGLLIAAAEPSAGAEGAAAAEVPLVASRFTEARADGSLCWEITLPPLEIGEGEMRFSLWLREMEKSILRNMGNGLLAQTEPVAFAVRNRQPVVRKEPEKVYTVYTPVEGVEKRPVTLALSDFFEEVDRDQSLEYGLVTDGQWTQEAGLMSISGDQLFLSPGDASAVGGVTVRARDPYGAGADAAFTVQWIVLEEEAGKMRFALSQQGDTQLGRETELIWRLPGAETAAYRDARRQYPELLDLAQALQVEEMEGVAFDPLRWEGEELVLRAVVAASGSSSEMQVRPRAALHVGDRQLMLPDLFPDAAQVITCNTAPVLAEGVEAQAEPVKGCVKDVPLLLPQSPLLVPVAGGDTFVLADFFADAETDAGALTYLILADHPDVALRKGEAPLAPAEGQELVPPGREGWRCWVVDGGGDALSLAMEGPGKAQIEIYAWDGEFFSPPMARRVEAQSYGSRLLRIGGLALAAAAALIIGLILLRRLRRPSFSNVILQIAHRPYASIRGQLDLSCYGKQNVNFMTLTAAAGMPPVEGLGGEILSHIELKPWKQNGFRMVFKGGAEGRVRLDPGGAQPEKRRVIAPGQPVSILSMEKEEGITICLARRT